MRSMSLHRFRLATVGVAIASLACTPTGGPSTTTTAPTTTSIPIANCEAASPTTTTTTTSTSTSTTTSTSTSTSTSTTTTTTPPSGPIIIGYLSNFDVPNGSGEPEHGFEIEIEDIAVNEVSYTYGNARYGLGRTVTAATFTNGKTGVLIRYAATYNAGAWSATTPPNAVEHFGATLRAASGTQRFNWLGEDPAHPGTLIRRGGTTTSGGAITIPIPVPAPVVVDRASGTVIEQDVVNGIVEPGETMLPDAVWVQRYASSLDRHATLDELMADNPTITQSREESILDGQFELIDGGESLADDDPVSSNDCASLLTFDTFEYTGPYDDSHTPLCDGAGGATDCLNFVGPRIATMMSAANIAPPGG